MIRCFVTVALALWLSSAMSFAQQPPSPVPLYPGAAPRSIVPQPLPPFAPAAEPAGSANTLPAAAAPTSAPAMPAPMSAPAGREFCEQPVTVQLAERDAIAEPYRRFVGIWSDASWTPQLCAALIVENVAPDGTASIVYVFGPMQADAHGPGGILQGTGIVGDGELRFQNSDGSQFAFRPLYADLEGHLTTPKGQSYQAIFKQTP